MNALKAPLILTAAQDVQSTDGLEGLLFIAVCLLCAILFLVIGLLARRKKYPAQFWSGWKVNERNVKNVKAYNKAYSRMWLWYALAWFLAGCSPMLTSAPISLILICLVCFGGIGVILLVYKKIYNKYTF